MACCNERLRLGPSGLGGHDRLADQLRQTACGAQPHLQRMTGVRAGVPAFGEMVARWLVTEVEHQTARPPTAEATDGLPSHVE